jgi:hypothetical protein
MSQPIRHWRGATSPPSKQLNSQQATVGQLQAQIQGDQAAIENAQAQPSYTTLASPIDGVTSIRLVDPGNLIRAADATGIVVITRVKPISVVVTLLAGNLAEDLPGHGRGTATGSMWSSPTRLLRRSRCGCGLWAVAPPCWRAGLPPAPPWPAPASTSARPGSHHGRTGATSDAGWGLHVMNLSAPFIARLVATILLMVALFLLGPATYHLSGLGGPSRP